MSLIGASQEFGAMNSAPSDMIDSNGLPHTVMLSVVVPAYNSVGVIEATVRRLAERLAGVESEIIVVENGSSDGTLAYCQDLASTWDCESTSLTVLSSEKGMGNALSAGALVSRGRRVLLTADDLPFGFDDLDADATFGDNPPPVLVGSKSHADSAIHRGFVRDTMTFGFAALRRVALNMRTGDPQGTFVVDGALLRGLVPKLREPGFLFTTELAYALELRGIRAHEVPVRLSTEHSSHGTRVSRADVVSMGLGLLRLRKRRAEYAAQ
ncbi:MAG: glycosyltransferase [Mycobacteriaceae bacterium]